MLPTLPPNRDAYSVRGFACNPRVIPFVSRVCGFAAVLAGGGSPFPLVGMTGGKREETGPFGIILFRSLFILIFIYLETGSSATESTCSIRVISTSLADSRERASHIMMGSLGSRSSATRTSWSE